MAQIPRKNRDILSKKKKKECRRQRVDIDFREETGINVNARNLKSCLEFFYLFFTQEVWVLLVCQTDLWSTGVLILF